jgi:hypothetical protein
MLNRNRHRLMLPFSIVACVLSVAMLLSFPAGNAHRFNPHFRSPEVRRTAERHTSIASPSHVTDESALQPRVMPTFFAPMQSSATALGRDRGFASPAEVPVLRLLNRLKLCTSGSSGQDPLLAA